MGRCLKAALLERRHHGSPSVRDRALSARSVRGADEKDCGVGAGASFRVWALARCHGGVYARSGEKKRLVVLAKASMIFVPQRGVRKKVPDSRLPAYPSCVLYN